MTDLGQLLYGFDPAYPDTAPLVFSVSASGVVTHFEHDACTISTFCRNPLHPGPCKGWKKKLGVIAPGSLHAINNAAKAKLAEKRKATAAAKSAADKAVTAKGHYHPLLHKKAVVKNTNLILGNDEAKASGKASKVILNKTEIKKYSKLKGAQIGSVAVSRGLTSDQAKYSAYAEKLIGDALAKDNQEGGHGNFVHAISSMGDALASSFADKHCGVGTPDGDCDGATHEGVKIAVTDALIEGLLTGNMDKFDARAKGIADAKDQDELKAAISKAGVDLPSVEKMLYGGDEDEQHPDEPVKGAPEKPKAEAPAAPAADLPYKDMTENQKTLVGILGVETGSKTKKAQAVEKAAAKLTPEEYDSLPDSIKEQLNDQALNLPEPDVLQELMDAVPEAGGPMPTLTPEEKAAHLANAVADQIQANGEFLSADEKVDLLADVQPDAFVNLTPAAQKVLLNAIESLSDHGYVGKAPFMKKLTGSPDGHPGLSPAQIKAGQAIAFDFAEPDKMWDAIDGLSKEEFEALPADLVKTAVKDIKFGAKTGDQKAQQLADKLNLSPTWEEMKESLKAEEGALPTPPVVSQVGPGAKPLSAAAQAAVGYGMGSKSGTAKQKLAAYEQLTPEEFEQISPSAQGLILADLDKISGKFLDPKKKEHAAAVKLKLSLASGGGSGAGGTADTTAPDPGLGASPSLVDVDKADLGAEKIVQISGWVGFEDADGSVKSAIEGQLLKAHMNGTIDTEAAKVAGDVAASLVDDFIQDPDNQIPLDAKPDFMAVLVPDIKNAIAQNKKPTPVLDAFQAYHEKGKLHPTSKSVAADDVEEAVLKAHEDLNGDPNLASSAQIAKLHESLGVTPPLFDDFVAGDETKVANALANKVFAKMVVDTGVKPIDTWTPDEFQKVADTLKADTLKSIVSGQETGSGLPAKLPEFSKNTNDLADKLAAQNGWAPNSPVLDAWKASHLKAQIQDYLDGNGGGSPAGAGGSSTHSAPAAVKDAVKSAVPTVSTPPVTGTDASGKLSDAHKLTIHSAYKSFGAGAYITAADSEKFDNLAATAAALAGKAGFPKKLSIADVMKAVDEQVAGNLGVPNTNVLENKIKEWMATPDGAAYVKGHAVSPSKVNGLAGYTTPPPDLPKLPAGHKIQKKGGPGKYDPDKPASDFRGFKPAEAQKELDDYLFNNNKVLSADHWKAVTAYTGSAYAGMNSYLRGKDMFDNPYPPEKASSQTKMQVQLIQDAMVPLQNDHILKRGTGWEFVPKEYRSAEKLKELIGKNITDDAFMSTTIGGAGGHFSGKPVILTIEAPAGSHALFVKNKSHFSGENEMLLAAGTRFRVLTVTDKGGQTHVRLRVVTPK